jgi:signal transduction histidine kinase
MNGYRRRALTGRRSRPEAVLHRFTARLGPPIEADELLLQLVEALRASLRASRAEVWMVDAAGLPRRVSVPHDEHEQSTDVDDKAWAQLRRPLVFGTAWARMWLPGLLERPADASLRFAPVVNDGEPLAVLVVERPAAHDFSSAEERMLAELARHLGLTLHNDRLRVALEASLANVRRANADLQLSRARIVEAADAERRRIERDLHDGTQQELLALAIELRLARDALGAAAPEVAMRLEKACANAERAMDELVDLAHGIYPPVLRNAGLEAAVRAAARRHPYPVQIHADGIARQPAAVEAAVYFAVLEAMQNAAKHAAHATVTVTLSEQPGQLLFVVADDGPGFVFDASMHGHGVLNVSDRIGAVGGWVTWETGPGAGTRVCGSVPTDERSLADQATTS